MRWSKGEIAATAMLAAFFLGVLALQISQQSGSKAQMRIQGYPLAEVSEQRSRPFPDQIPASLAEKGADSEAGGLLADGGEGQATADDNTRLRLPNGSLAPDGNGVPAISLGDQQLLRIDFDLGPRGGGNMEVRKAVMLNGRGAGTVNVSIDRSSQLHLSSQDLGALLPDAHPVQEILDGETVTFDLLRSRGLDIRYDPVGDVLIIGT